jgi:hypothetical protein
VAGEQAMNALAAAKKKKPWQLAQGFSNDW